MGNQESVQHEERERLGPQIASGGNGNVWQIHRGSRVTSGTIDKYSVLKFPKSAIENEDSAGQQSHITNIKNSIKVLSTIRHPSILRVRSQLREDSTHYFVETEEVYASLSNLLHDHSNIGQVPTELKQYKLDPLHIKLGIMSVANALIFLHGAKLVHLNVTPGSIFVTPQGEWKLGGFEFAVRLMGDGPAQSSYVTQEYDSFIKLPKQPLLDYSAPEYTLLKKYDEKADVWSLGCLSYKLLHSSGNLPLATNNNFLTFKQLLQHLHPIPMGCLPGEVQDVLPEMLSVNPAHRASLEEFLGSTLFKDMKLQTLVFFEKLYEQPLETKAKFISQVHHTFDDFPAQLLKERALPVLLREFKHEKVLRALLVSPIAKISTKLTPAQFNSHVWQYLEPVLEGLRNAVPAIAPPPRHQIVRQPYPGGPKQTVKLSPPAKPPPSKEKVDDADAVALATALLHFFPVFMRQTSENSRAQEILLLFLFECMDKTASETVNSAIQIIHELLEYVQYHSIRKHLLPRLCLLTQATPRGDGTPLALHVRLNALVSLGLLLSEKVIDGETVKEIVLPTLERLVTQREESSHMVGAILTVYNSSAARLDHVSLTERVAPYLMRILLLESVTPAQFRRASDGVKEIVRRIEMVTQQEFSRRKQLTSGRSEAKARKHDTAVSKNERDEAQQSLDYLVRREMASQENTPRRTWSVQEKVTGENGGIVMASQEELDAEEFREAAQKADLELLRGRKPSNVMDEAPMGKKERALLQTQREKEREKAYTPRVLWEEEIRFYSTDLKRCQRDPMERKEMERAKEQKSTGQGGGKEKGKAGRPMKEMQKREGISSSAGTSPLRPLSTSSPAPVHPTSGREYSAKQARSVGYPSTFTPSPAHRPPTHPTQPTQPYGFPQPAAPHHQSQQPFRPPPPSYAHPPPSYAQHTTLPHHPGPTDVRQSIAPVARQPQPIRSLEPTPSRQPQPIRTLEPTPSPQPSSDADFFRSLIR